MVERLSIIVELSDKVEDPLSKLLSTVQDFQSVGVWSNRHPLEATVYFEQLKIVEELIVPQK